MTHLLSSLSEIASTFDVAVLDQWGVLHDGEKPYPGAVQALRDLQAAGKDIVVLSNSGKRADLNLRRIAGVGLPVEMITRVVTSGEALWEDLTQGRLTTNDHPIRSLLPLCSAPDDARIWLDDAQGLVLTSTLDATTDALLLMGLPDGSSVEVHDPIFRDALKLNLPCLCSNPDKVGVRAEGMVLSPGQLADRYEKQGGTVLWYGKPWPAVYETVRRVRPDLSPDRFLMVGDSLEHDIGGGAAAGFQTAFIRGGIHAADFNDPEDIGATLAQLAAHHGIALPSYSLAMLT